MNTRDDNWRSLLVTAWGSAGARPEAVEAVQATLTLVEGFPDPDRVLAGVARMLRDVDESDEGDVGPRCRSWFGDDDPPVPEHTMRAVKPVRRVADDMAFDEARRFVGMLAGVTAGV